MPPPGEASARSADAASAARFSSDTVRQQLVLPLWYTCATLELHNRELTARIHKLETVINKNLKREALPVGNEELVH